MQQGRIKDGRGKDNVILICRGRVRQHLSRPCNFSCVHGAYICTTVPLTRRDPKPWIDFDMAFPRCWELSQTLLDALRLQQPQDQMSWLANYGFPFFHFLFFFLSFFSFSFLRVCQSQKNVCLRWNGLEASVETQDGQTAKFESHYLIQDATSTRAKYFAMRKSMSRCMSMG